MADHEGLSHGAATVDNCKRQVESLINAKKYEEAARLVREKLNPRDSDSNYYLGLAAYYMNDFDSAHEGFRASLAVSPNARAFYGFGLTLRRRGKARAALKAFEEALRLNPLLAKAKIQIAELKDELKEGERSGGSNPTQPPPFSRSTEASTPPLRPDRSPASAGSPGPKVGAGDQQDKTFSATANEKVYKSLADLLDLRSPFRPGDKDLAGSVVWSSAPSLRSLIGHLIVAILIILTPILLHQIASAAPAGLMGAAAAWVWRITEAVALPAALLTMVRALGLWATTLYVLREHRIEIYRGIINRQHTVFWLHDLERPITVRQNLWQLLVGTGTIRFESTMLPSNRRRSARDLNLVDMEDLSIAVSERVAARIRADVMWQRRRMVQNFVSSR